MGAGEAPGSQASRRVEGDKLDEPSAGGQVHQTFPVRTGRSRGRSGVGVGSEAGKVMRSKRPLLLSVAAAAALAVLAVLWLAARPHPPIHGEEARQIAQEMLGRYLQDTMRSGSEFGPATVEEHPDGWDFRYPVKGVADSNLGIFVRRDGSADYNEAPEPSPSNGVVPRPIAREGVGEHGLPARPAHGAGRGRGDLARLPRRLRCSASAPRLAARERAGYPLQLT